MLVDCSFIPVPGHILCGNLEAYILTWIETPLAFSWKETAVPLPMKQPKSVLRTISNCSSTQSSVEIPDFYKSKHGRDEFSLEILVSDLCNVTLMSTDCSTKRN